jgi:antitoxin (DNA-binding transcriptional repressor) of toxin-antitoxin stability system
VTIEDGIAYDAKRLLEDVASMVEKQKQARTGAGSCRSRIASGLPDHWGSRMAPGAAEPLQMCHNVHMKTISIRELHLQTGRWVRHAASRGPVVVTDRGRRIAALQPFDAAAAGRPLPNREARIRRRSTIPVDSVTYQSELREER